MVFGIAALVVAMIALVVVFVRVRVGPSLVKQTVVVHTKDEKTIRGVLYGQYSDRVTLREASAILGRGKEQALGGLQHVPNENVSFIQQIERKAA